MVTSKSSMHSRIFIYTFLTTFLFTWISGVDLCTGNFEVTVTDFPVHNFGVVFPPYNRFEESIDRPIMKDGSFEYPKDCIQDLIDTAVRMGFKRIVTQQMIQPIDTDARDITGKLAATMNSKHNKSTLEVSYGITMNSSKDHTTFLKTIENGIRVAKDANLIYNNTVTSLVLQVGGVYCLDECTSNEHCERKYNFHCPEFLTPREINQVADMIHKKGLQFGIRTLFCDDFFSELIKEKSARNLTVLWTEVDFFICVYYPNHRVIPHSNISLFYDQPGWAAHEFRSNLLKWKEVSKGVVIYGETGWRKEASNSFESRDLQKEYWEIVSNWSLTEDVPINFFNIIDEVSNLSADAVKDTFSGYGLLRKTFSKREAASFDQKTAIYLVLMGSVCAFGLLAWLVYFLKLCKSKEGICIKLHAGESPSKKYKRRGISCSKKQIKRASNSNDEFENTTLDESKVVVFNYQSLVSEVVLNTKFNFEIGEIIDTGNYATVYHGFITKDLETKKVAWKISNVRNANNDVLLQELKTLSMPALLHENICQMVMHMNIKGFMGIALEFCENGSLKHKLDELSSEMDQPFVENSKFQLKFNEIMPRLLQWSKKIATGMEHLERLKIVHADLSAKNVLLDANYTAKVSDFGLSCRVYSNLNSQEPGKNEIAWPWASYETLTRKEFSSKSDVWSFGMTLVEIYSLGNHPIPPDYNLRDLVKELKEGWRPERPSYLAKDQMKIYSLMLKCWTMDRMLRPSFEYIRQFFEASTSAIDILKNTT